MTTKSEAKGLAGSTAETESASASNTPSKCDLFSSRHNCLVNSMSDSRRIYRVLVGEVEFWGLAATPHQFRNAVADTLLPDNLKPLTRDEIQSAFAEELQSMSQRASEKKAASHE